MVYKRFSGGTRSIPTPVGKPGSKKNKGRTGRAGGAVTPTPVKRTKPKKLSGKMTASKAVVRKRK